MHRLDCVFIVVLSGAHVDQGELGACAAGLYCDHVLIVLCAHLQLFFVAAAVVTGDLFISMMVVIAPVFAVALNHFAKLAHRFHVEIQDFVR